MADSSKNFKLLVSDYDGTIAGRDHKISDKLITAVKKWQDTGNIFTLATGRQFLMLKDLCETLNLKDPIITRGGAEIVDPKTGKILYSKIIKESTLEKLLEILKENKFQISIEVNDTVFTDFYLNKNFSLVTFLPLNEFEMQDVPKLVIFAEGEDADKKAEFMEDDVVKQFPQLHIVKIHSALGHAWDITSLEATKHLAVLELLKILNIKREEAVGVGDGYNDFPLLEAVGLKVAMGNANQELKEIADMEVPSQEDDGVAYLINKLLE